MLDAGRIHLRGVDTGASADEVRIDYSSLTGAAAYVRSPQALMTEWATVLPGFDATRHALSNIKAEVSADEGRASADVVAGHWIGAQYWEVAGCYAYELARDDGEWKITSMTFSLARETGSRDVCALAAEAARLDPAPYIVRQNARQTVLDFLTGLERKDMGAVNAVWADDAVQDMPFAPAGWDNQIVGREALIRQYAQWPTIAGAANFTRHLVFHPTLDPRTVFVEDKGEVDIIPTGLTYRQTYGGLFHVEDCKIALFREYFDPREFERAFGLNR